MSSNGDDPRDTNDDRNNSMKICWRGGNLQKNKNDLISQCRQRGKEGGKRGEEVGGSRRVQFFLH